MLLIFLQRAWLTSPALARRCWASAYSSATCEKGRASGAVEGVIVGRALYDGRVRLDEALGLLEGAG